MQEIKTNNMEEKYIASIDLGSSKFGICVARVTGDDVQIVYYKETPSEGIRSSLIANPMKASQKLKEAVREAEQELMIQILQVVVGMPRNEVAQVTASARIDRSNPDDYITAEEVATLKSIALETYPLDNPDKQIIYGAVAQSFSIDDEIQLVEEEVVGTLSSVLEGNFKVFVGNRSATTALDKIFNQMGISIAKKYFLPEVVARTVLTDEERSSGVALVDVGAGVTSLGIYHGGIMRYYASIPFGGKVITGDVRTECSISEDLAEKIKKRFGACQPGKLANFVSLVKEMSGYEVRKGYPRFMFSASVGSGVYATGATSAIGMVLAAKEDGLPDCVSMPERVMQEEEEEMMEVEVTDETPAQNTISDEELASGETGSLISPEEFGEAVKKETKKTKVKVKKEKNRPNFLGIAWTKIKNTALDFYDDENKDNTEE